MSGPLILIMAGGTGGHVFPALAVARALQEAGARVAWVGTRCGIEARVIPEAGIPIDWLSVGGLRGSGLLAWLLAPARLSVALLQALRVLMRRKPDIVLGLGGFVTGPGGVAAWLLRKPLVIHEQNALAGLTNRLLARLAECVLEAFPDSFPAHVPTRVTGNPVRREILGITVPEQRLAGRGSPAHLLVIGGSLGALSLNKTVPDAVARLREDIRPEIRHQTGGRTMDSARQAYRVAGVDAQLVEFIDDMAAAYSWADLVIARAGALTVSELSVAGIGSVLVPYPYAVDDHQALNANYLVRDGAAVLLTEDKLSADRLARELDRLLSDRSQLLAMAKHARELSRPAATTDIANICLGLASTGAVS